MIGFATFGNSVPKTVSNASKKRKRTILSAPSLKHMNTLYHNAFSLQRVCLNIWLTALS
jgi:hypothetical protein